MASITFHLLHLHRRRRLDAQRAVRLDAQRARARGRADLGDDEGPMDNCGTAVGTEAHTYLFDLKNDPSETMDLSGEKPEVRDALKARLTELMATEAASIWKAETSEAYGAWASHHNCISPWIDAR